MKLWKKNRHCFLALILILTVVIGMIAVPGAFAEEDTEGNENAVVQNEGTNSEQEENVTSAEKTADSKSNEKAKKDTEARENTPATLSETDTNEEVDTKETADTSAYGAKVTIGDVALSEADENKTNSITDWTKGESKVLNVNLSRTSTAVEAGKKYVLCLKVSDVLYFNGLPEAEKINGVERVTIKQNEAPVVYTNNGNQAAISDFSSYSGEIRLELNPAVENVSIKDLGIGYDERLVGYTNGKQSIKNSIQVSVIAVDQIISLDDITDQTTKENVLSYNVDSAEITTGSVGSGRRNTLSPDGFTEKSMNEQDVKIGKDGKISYAASAAGLTNQVYKKLKIVFECPYIEKGDKKYYLDFSKDDMALTDNKQGNQKGFKLAENVEYDKDKHTLTYYFENIYLGGYTQILYTPQFSWPNELKDEEIPADTEYQISGCEWSATEQEGYTGATSSFPTDKYSSNHHAWFIADQVNIKMRSSDEAESSLGIAKREIYKGLTKGNGYEGALGFFDIHNEGSKDSSDVKVTFEFNTGKTTDPQYYVTKINLPIKYTSGMTLQVEYTLSNGTDEVSGTTICSNMTYYSASSAVSCDVAALRADKNVGTDYYIKKLSYTTNLGKSTNYHVETAHLNRNRPADGGLFFGYIDGKVGEYASAKMTIKSEDEITADGKKELSSTERSKIGEDDYIAYSLQKMSVGGKETQAITAGNSSKIKFGVNVSNEEYARQGTTVVNGYHVFRDGIFYVCLPEDVSIAGTEQITLSKGKVTSLEKLKGTSCMVDGVQSNWWKIEADEINAVGGSGFSVEVQLETNEQMKSVIWNSQNCVAVRTKGQEVSWGAAGSYNTLYATADAMTNTSTASLNALGAYLKSDTYADKLGLSAYNANGNVKLNISRAEAMLEVDTKLKTADSTSTNLKISSEDTEISYDITISSTDGGTANDFAYYIPIVSTSSAIDASMMVNKNEFGVSLQKAIEVKKLNGEGTDLPYNVLYTTDEGLNSQTIRADSVKWKTEESMNADFSEVTAIKIVTQKDEFIKDKDSYEFSCKLKYDNSANDFERMAGSKIQWRSFGHYTYTRNGDTTTNSYPSADNSVTIIYQKDYTKDDSEVVKAVLDTGADSNKVNVEKGLKNTFAREQTLEVKKVEVSEGTQLISLDPADLTGADANSQFQVSYNVNSGNAGLLTKDGMSNKDRKWTISAGTDIRLLTAIEFSKALTDITTPRYMDITIGNDNIDITYRIVLNRTVKASDASASGLAVGEHYKVPSVAESQSIAKNSAVSALIVVKDFVPGNNKTQVIAWKDSDGKLQSLPENTSITMMEISDKSAVTSYWVYSTGTDEKVIDLSKFTRMGGTEKYSYNSISTAHTELRYLFVVDFENSNVEIGRYQFDFGSGDATGVSSLLGDKQLTVDITNKTTYQLTSTVQSDDKLNADITYTVNRASGNDSYSEGRTLALVLKPALETDASSLPEDACIQVGDDIYHKNSENCFIIPVGTIESGDKNIELVSNMFPDEEKSYTFNAELYVVNLLSSSSLSSSSPLNGDKVASTQFILTKEKKGKPSMKISGVQVADTQEWIAGQEINFAVKNIPAEGSVTVTAYYGLDSTQRATNILSSVSGVFTISNGSGTYDSSKTPTGKLVLSSSTQKGTYRLEFEMKDAANKTVATESYYIVVR